MNQVEQFDGVTFELAKVRLIILCEKKIKCYEYIGYKNGQTVKIDCSGGI